MARKGYIKRISKIFKSEDEKEFRSSKIEGTKQFNKRQKDKKRRKP